MFQRLRQKPSPSDQKSASLAEVVSRYGLGDTLGSTPPASFTSNVVAYRCIRMVSEAAASVPLLVQDHGGVLSDTWLGALLAQPHPDRSGTELLEEVYGYLQTHGNAFIERFDGDDGPLALDTIHPDSIEVTDEGLKQRRRSGERILRPDARGQMPVLHLALWQPGQGRRGRAPLQVAREAIHLHNAATLWNRQLLENAARPSGALIHRGTSGGEHLTPEQFDRLRHELDEGFSGFKRAGRPLLLDGGLDWRPMGLTPAEMDFQGLKNQAARDIALAFGVPPMLLGIPGDNTYANYREANLAFWRQTVLPLVSKTALRLGQWLDPGRTHVVSPDIGQVEALAPERSARLDRIAAADFLTDAEKRTSLGFPAYPEGIRS